MTSIDIEGICRDAAYKWLCARFPSRMEPQIKLHADIAATAYRHGASRSENARALWQEIRRPSVPVSEPKADLWRLRTVLLVVDAMSEAVDAAVLATETEREDAQSIGSLAALMQYGPVFRALGRVFEGIDGHEGKTPQEVIVMLRELDGGNPSGRRDLVEPGTMADLVEAALECGLVGNEPGGGV